MKFVKFFPLLLFGMTLFLWFWFHSQVLYNSHPDPAHRIRRLELLTVFTQPTASPWWTGVKQLWPLVIEPERLQVLAMAECFLMLALCQGWGILAIVPLTTASFGEFIFFRLLVGLGVLSLEIFFAAWCGWLGLESLMLFFAGMTLAIWGSALAWHYYCRPVPSQPVTPVPKGKDGLVFAWGWRVLLFLLASLFLSLSLFIATLPTPDFDAMAYHLLGPKEWWRHGRMELLPHNVYTAFPFLTEMFSLAGMVATNQWERGGLVGQTILWHFNPITALGIYLWCRSLCHAGAGWFAVLIYCTTPWVYRLGSIPYVEGALLAYTLAATYAAWRWRQLGPSQPGQTPRWGWAFLTGFCIGCAMACKYTGLLTAGFPAALLFIWPTPQQISWRQRLHSLFPAATGLLLAIGPWLVRNFVWFYNPVYPLGYSLFGSHLASTTGLDAPQLAHFAHHHQPNQFHLTDLWQRILEVVALSDWQTGLFVTSLPLLGLAYCRRAVWMLSVLTVLEFALYWFGTHRLDRFWLPLLPFATMLAGIGWAAFWFGANRATNATLNAIEQQPDSLPSNLFWRRVSLIVIFSITLIYQFLYITTELCGLNLYSATIAERRGHQLQMQPSLALLQALGQQLQTQSPETTPHFICLGYAAVYDAPFPTDYSTPWNLNPLERLLPSNATSLAASDYESLHEHLIQAQIDYIVVDWRWVHQYRQPGNYGYSARITPEWFSELQARGVLLPEIWMLQDRQLVTVYQYPTDSAVAYRVAPAVPPRD